MGTHELPTPTEPAGDVVEIVFAEIQKAWFQNGSRLERTYALIAALSDRLLPPGHVAVPMTLVPRPEVLAFAVLMERQLRANDHKPGWKEDSPLSLADRVVEEAAELHDCNGIWDCAANSPAPAASVAEVAREAADVANMAMMVADVCGCLLAATCEEKAR